MAQEKVYLTKHTVHLTKTPGKPGDKSKGISPTAPVVKEIAAGRRVSLDPDDDTTLELLDAGAIVLAPVEEGSDEVETMGDKPAKKPARRAPAKKTTAAAKKTTASAKDDGAGKGDGDDGDDGNDLV